MSKSNQTRYGVLHVYLKRKTKRIFGIACLGKKFVFQSKFRLIRLFYFQKYRNFYQIKQLSKSNQTRYGVLHVYLKRKTKRIFGIACLGKKFLFQSKFRLIRLFYFQKYRNFTGSSSCPNRTKLAMEYCMCT